MTITMTLPAAFILVGLSVLFGMIVGAALVCEVLERRQPPLPPIRVPLAHIAPDITDTAPFPAADFYWSQWRAELDAAHRAAELETSWLTDAGELAIPAR